MEELPRQNFFISKQFLGKNCSMLAPPFGWRPRKILIPSLEHIQRNFLMVLKKKTGRRSTKPHPTPWFRITYRATASLPVTVALLGRAKIHRIGRVRGRGPAHNSCAVVVSILSDGEGEQVIAVLGGSEIKQKKISGALSCKVYPNILKVGWGG